MREDTDAPDEIVHVADNVDEFVERTRLKQIHEAKEEAANALREAHFEAKNGDPVSAAEYARGAVEMYVMEVEALYHRTERGRELWEDAHFGDVSLGELAPALDLDDDTEIKTIDMHTRGDALPVDLDIDQRSGEIRGGAVEVVGVGTFVDGLSGRMTAAVLDHGRNGWQNPDAVEETTQSADLVPPIWLSREVYRATNALLSESDVGVKLLDEGEGEAEWDTSYRKDDNE